MTIREARYALCRLKMALRQYTTHTPSEQVRYGIRHMAGPWIVDVSAEQIEQATDIAQLLPSEVQHADKA